MTSREFPRGWVIISVSVRSGFLASRMFLRSARGISFVPSPLLSVSLSGGRLAKFQDMRGGWKRETDNGMLGGVDRAVPKVADEHRKRLAREEVHDPLGHQA